MSSNERRKELRRRRHRRTKITKFKNRASKATTSEKVVIAEKIRRLTPGSQLIIDGLDLEER